MLWLLVSEMVVWKTVRITDITLPFAVTILGAGWMAVQREYYIG